MIQILSTKTYLELYLIPPMAMGGYFKFLLRIEQSTNYRWWDSNAV